MRRALEDKVKRIHRVLPSETENGDPLIKGNVPIGVGTKMSFWGLVSVQYFLKFVLCACLAMVRPI